MASDVPPTSENGLLAVCWNEYIKENRRKRRWGIFFKSLFFLYILAITVPMLEERETHTEVHTALVELEGVISATDKANADDMVASLRKAFEAKNSRGIILRINSPGGSPVQADHIYNEIMRLRKIYPDKKLYAVIGEVGASAAYYIAASADAIYAAPASIVGSIGVILPSFGFVDLLEKIGVENRTMVSGEHKDLLDPFAPKRDYDVNFMQSILNTVHAQFIDKVKEGRGNRLANNPDIFSGLVWVGKEAKDLGLIDGFGSAGTVARDIIQAEDILDYTIQENVLDKLASRLGAYFAGAITSGSKNGIEWR